MKERISRGCRGRRTSTPNDASHFGWKGFRERNGHFVALSEDEFSSGVCEFCSEAVSV